MSTTPPDPQVATGIPEVERFRKADQEIDVLLFELQEAESLVRRAKKALCRDHSPWNFGELQRCEARVRRLTAALDMAEGRAERLLREARRVAPDVAERARRSVYITAQRRAYEDARQREWQTSF